MFLKKILQYFKIIILVYMGLFIYGVFTDRSLGKGYVWTCFEPGCVLLRESQLVIYGNIRELGFNEQFIVGKVDKPNKWMMENESAYNIEGYFIVDKYNHTKKIRMDKEEYMDECKKYNITNTKLKYQFQIVPIFDPYYWYVIFKNNFD